MKRIEQKKLFPIEVRNSKFVIIQQGGDMVVVERSSIPDLIAALQDEIKKDEG